MQSPKERYEFSVPEYDKPLSCNIYMIKAGKIHYFGLETIDNELGLRISVIPAINYLIKKYGCQIDDVFFYQWDPKNSDSGVESIEIEEADGSIRIKKIKKYCPLSKNPLI